jgi:hypothetical protein
VARNAPREAGCEDEREADAARVASFAALAARGLEGCEGLFVAFDAAEAFEVRGAGFFLFMIFSSS